MKKSILALLAIPLLIMGCEEEQTYTNDFVEAEMSLSKETASLGETGTSDAIEVTTEETALDATVDYAYKTWLDASVSGKSIVIKAIADNPTTEPREGRILITAGEKGKTVQKTITVTQEGAVPATLTLSTDAIDLEKEENSSKEVTYSSNKDVVATSSAPDWCSVTLSAGKIVITAISANTEFTPRYADVVVMAGSGQITAEKTIKVSQKAPEAVLDIIQADRDAAEFDALDVDVEAVNYTANVAVSATVSEGASSWLKAELDEVSVKISVTSANIGTTSRTGVVTLAGGTASASITVSQKNTVIGMAYGTEGVIFWQNPENPKQVKIISAKAEKQNWSTAATATGATADEADPANNIAKVKAMMDYATNGYIVKWCEDLGEGWYMPSLSELKDLFTGYNGVSYDMCTNDVPGNITAYEKLARKVFEDSMASIGGVAINSQAETANGDSIWSVRESGDGKKAYWVRYGKKGSDSGNKVAASPSRFARAVKVVTLE